MGRVRRIGSVFTIALALACERAAPREAATSAMPESAAPKLVGEPGSSREAGGHGPALSAELIPGLPDFAPLRRQDFDRSYTAEILVPGRARPITFVLGIRDGSSMLWLMTRFEDGTVNLRRVRERWEVVQLDSRSPESRRLRLALAPDRRSLRYEWGETVPSLVHVQEPLPDFEARLLEGGAFRTRDLRGRTLVLDSWSTTCVPCVVELPELNRIVAELASDSIEFVAVAPEEEATVREFLSHRPFRYRQAVTDPEQGTVLGQAFPRHVVVDGEGIVVFDQVGYESGGLDAMRAAILKAQPVPGKERTR